MTNETEIKVLRVLPANMRINGWVKGGTTSDRSILSEIQRDYAAAGKLVSFTRGAMDDVHYWFKPGVFKINPNRKTQWAQVEQYRGFTIIHRVTQISDRFGFTMVHQAIADNGEPVVVDSGFATRAEAIDAAKRDIDFWLNE
jgi:hypothetical protein